MTQFDAKAMVRAYFHRLLNEKDLSICDELLAADYRDHDAPPEALPGPESIRAFAAGFLAEYPDMRVEIEEIIAEGNMVAARLVWRGSHWETGGVYHRRGLVMLRLDADGRIAERWSAYRPHE